MGKKKRQKSLHDQAATRGAAPVSGKRPASKLWKLLPVIIIIVAVAAVRIRLLDFPLERDEGEYAYFGQLILQGIPPYQLAYNMKFPGAYVVYALIMALFGQTARGIHFGFLLINSVTVLLIYALSKKLMSQAAAIVATAAYAFLSLSPSVLGFAAHAAHFVVMAMLLGFLQLLKAFRKNKTYYYLVSGILFGLACIMKQAGILFCIFGALAVLLYHLSARPIRFGKLFLKTAVFSLGVMTPLLLMFFLLTAAGVLKTFWFWTMTYAASYGTRIPMLWAWAIFLPRFRSVVDGYYGVWIFSALGLGALLFNKQFGKKRFMLPLFALFSFLSVCPGFYFRSHYFVTLLPAIALFSGVSFDYLSMKTAKNRYIIIGLFALMFSIGIVHQRDYLFKLDTRALSRKIYASNPFPESVEISKFIKARTAKDDTIAVLGSEPQIYFYAQRRSATGYIYMYGLMERHKHSLSMQQEMAREIEEAKPAFLVDVHVRTSWLTQPDSNRYILDWSRQYIAQHYAVVGLIDIFADKTNYAWGPDARRHTARSKQYLLVYQRT